MQPNSTLPSPPSGDELYMYFGGQKRWVQLLMLASFIVAAVSLGRFVINSWWLLVFGLVLAFNVVGTVISAFSSLNRRRVTRAAHEQRIAKWQERGQFPPVDVYLPTCGEDLDVLENTYQHVRRLRYEGEVQVWVLDDGDRAEVETLATSYGFNYRVRPDRGHLKKAGNLSSAFGVTEGDFILILDADFVPRTDMLAHMMPYFVNPHVGLVQSPQYFDSTIEMNWLQRCAGATQELFYRWVQPSRDRVGAAICVGTCAIYRRQALESVGGFAQIEHSEDVHTGIKLLRGSFELRYVPILVSKGLCPDDLAGFLNQQYRWCNGSITLLRSGQANRHPLSIRQRLCFWAGFMYYITTALNVFVLHLPAVVMTVWFPEEVFSHHFIPFLLGVWVYMVLLPVVSKGRWRFEVLRLQMTYSFAHAVALWDKITFRTAPWVPTGSVGKGSPLARRVSWVGAIALTLILGSSWITVLHALVVHGPGKFWLMALFLLAYTYLAGPLLVAFIRLLLGHRTVRYEHALVRDSDEHLARRMSTVEAFSYTLVFVVIGIAATGFFDSVMPWELS